MDPALAVPGSAVFTMTDRPVPTTDASLWWRWTPGADWRHSAGPGSGIEDRPDHPVVHVAYQDALAYAAWAGKALPAQAEFEFAARGGLVDREFAWGDELAPGGVHLANTWQGLFPFANTAEDGWVGTSPVRSYPANGYGLYDMIGHVWERCEDWWSLPGEGPAKAKSPCCAVSNPRGGFRAKSFDPAHPGVRIPRKCSKAGRICVRPAIASVTAPPPAIRRASTVRPATSVSAA